MNNATYGNKSDLRYYIESNSKLNSQLGKICNLREIGEGGNGLVFHGILFDNDVAIKFLVETKSKEKLKRFKAEYLNIKLLPPSNKIVSTINYEEFDIKGQIYPAIIMKKHCGSLKRNTSAQPSYKELNNLFKWLLEVLLFIHANGIVHRDIKPENILIDNDGNFVLTDFGVASYNPDIFNLRAETHNNERVGNYLFSAPEQARGNAEAHPTMDIYALGQICQWYVTGNIHRGTNRDTLTKYIPESEIIDTVVAKCLSNKPEDRYQDIQSIIEDMENMQKKDPKEDPWNYLSEFGDALSASLPKGLNKATYITDKTTIDRLLTNIASKQFNNNLWFISDNGHMYITFEKLSDDIWLMGVDKAKTEIKIKSAWVYFDLALYGDLVLLNLEAMEPFGIYDSSHTYEEAALVDNSVYITRSEYDNGYAEKNREVLHLSEHKVELRSRYLTEKSIFIGTRFHSFFHCDNEEKIESFLKSANQGVELTENEFETFARKLKYKKHPDVLMCL